MKIYLIPGLGYDSRIFDGLNLGDHTVERINWIEPRKNEELKAYVKRLFEQLPADEAGIVLIGHSLGGIVAQEIATEKRIEKIILLSSIKARSEMPISFKLVKPLKLYRLFTKEWSIRTVKYWGKNHDLGDEKAQTLFKSMLAKVSNHYLQWALKALSNWKAPSLPMRTEILQIHGTADKTFPIKLIDRPDVVVEGGSHVMVYQEAEKLSEIINSELKSK